ncbi:MAG: phosphonopyruvate decarboxylase, partial [Gammaproteobacteria bacterium]|nr:phosphonopyruvate decarboxylase [Gammaproteobacteria bacterium]
MIDAEDFITVASSLGYDSYTGVPCSFLTPFINYVLNNNTLSYIGSANEGDAVATAAGMVIGGKKTIVMLQNSGLGNAVNPITSLLHTFKLPVLLIITLRGDPQLNDEPQHELMGKITEQMLDLMDIAWDYFPDKAKNIRGAFDSACEHMTSTHKPYAFVMKKGSVKNETLSETKHFNDRDKNSICHVTDNLSNKLKTRAEILNELQTTINSDDTVLLASTGFTGRELYALDDKPNQLYMVGSMGCASSLGLGLSMAQPCKKIIVIEGDGAAIMRMGNIATVGEYGGNNYLHVILDNEIHDSTGGQSTVSAGVNFAMISQACGYPASYYGSDPALISKLLNENQTIGPRMLHLKIKPGTMKDIPRPKELPHQVVRRLMDYLG